jgi:hypothetical protein
VPPSTWPDQPVESLCAIVWPPSMACMIYMNSADYEKFIREQYVKEKAMIERLGLAMKT